jgi:hypothetical protein
MRNNFIKILLIRLRSGSSSKLSKVYVDIVVIKPINILIHDINTKPVDGDLNK